jgi:type III secretion protein J
MAYCVQIVLPENDPLRRDSVPSSASVFIRYDPSTQINSLIPQIKMLVADGVAGLTYEKVSVVTVPATMSADRGSATGDDLVSIAGLWVYRSSAWILQTILGVCITLILALFCAVGWLASRQGLISLRRRNSTVIR